MYVHSFQMTNILFWRKEYQSTKIKIWNSIGDTDQRTPPPFTIMIIIIIFNLKVYVSFSDYLLCNKT